MADEAIPENVDLRFIAAQLGRVLSNQKHADHRFDGIEGRLGNVEDRLGKVEDRLGRVEIELAATRVDLAIVKDTVEDIKETARLMEGRLFRLEKHAGFAKA
jgi:hypothetical protein